MGLSKSPIGAFDGSRGIHPTGWGEPPHSYVAYATEEHVVPLIREMNFPATVTSSLRDENSVRRSRKEEIALYES